jgi:C-terminal processing protease CtpA/Prc
VRLVGETTVGMAFTAQVVKLSSGGSLRLSVGKIHTLAGKALCPKGLQPDDRVFHGPPDEATGKGDQILRRGLKVLGETARLKAAA